MLRHRLGGGERFDRGDGQERFGDARSTIDGAFARFGQQVAALQDPNGDGDGRSDIRCGGLSSGGKPAGHGSDCSSASGALIWKVEGTTPSELFGATLAAGSDFDQDSIRDLVISVPMNRIAGPECGRVSICAGNDLFLQADPFRPDAGLRSHPKDRTPR